MKKILLILGWMLAFAAACQKSEPTSIPEQEWFLSYPEHFPAPQFPADNQPTAARIELGRRLFYDPIMSVDSSISCGSCHLQEFAFANSEATTDGVFGRPGTRNVPGLFNLAYQPYFLREASLPTLEKQILVPIQEHNEFNSNIVDIAEKLKQISWYDSMSLIAYNRVPDAFVITRSISAFERTFVSASSKYDLVQTGKASFTRLESEGYTLFTQTLPCGKCHPEPFFTNFEAMNNGLYTNYSDPGRWRFTNHSEDSGSFKVPSLRNVALTAPYMYDGSIETLEEVITHYAKGGNGGTHQNPLIKSFTLSEHETDALIAFLQTLTDTSFTQNTNYRQKP